MRSRYPNTLASQYSSPAPTDSVFVPPHFGHDVAIRAGEAYLTKPARRKLPRLGLPENVGERRDPGARPLVVAPRVTWESKSENSANAFRHRSGIHADPEGEGIERVANASVATGLKVDRAQRGEADAGGVAVVAVSSRHRSNRTGFNSRIVPRDCSVPRGTNRCTCRYWC